jgi:hypothetical protein
LKLVTGIPMIFVQNINDKNASRYLNLIKRANIRLKAKNLMTFFNEKLLLGPTDSTHRPRQEGPRIERPCLERTLPRTDHE